MLMVNENFRAALELTDKILTGFNQGRGMASHMSKHTVQSIRIWHARIIILTKVILFSTASKNNLSVHSVKFISGDKVIRIAMQVVFMIV